MDDDDDRQLSISDVTLLATLPHGANVRAVAVNRDGTDSTGAERIYVKTTHGTWAATGDIHARWPSELRVIRVLYSGEGPES